jgi:hypothetical protein
MASLNTARAKSRDAVRFQDLSQIRNALELYALDNDGNYPPPGSRYTSRGKVVGDEKCGNGDDWGDSDGDAFVNYLSKYISELPKDPLNTDDSCYVYSAEGDLTGSSGAFIWATFEAMELGEDTTAGHVIGTVANQSNIVPSTIALNIIGVSDVIAGSAVASNEDSGDMSGYGCTDQAANNYNESATDDDGSCDYDLLVGGCTDSSYIEYNPSADIYDGSCLTTISLGCTNPSASNYSSSANRDDGSCVYEPIAGCTNSSYLEYNSSAITDDGSCQTAKHLGCTDSGANNYNSSANTNDGSCEYDVYGCTDSNASNYNSSANIDDESCSYSVSGCTDSSANNHNPSADTDDGSCTYDTYGCTDPGATNYNSSANVDDESCSYE